MLRVLHVSTGLELNGAERILVNCCEASRAAGFEPYVASLRPGGAAVALLESMGVPVLQLNAHPRRPNLVPLARLRNHVRTLMPDLMKGWMYHGNVFAAAAAFGASGLGGRRLCWGIYNSALDLKQYHWSMKAIIRAGALMSAYPAAIVYNSVTAQADHAAYGYANTRAVQIGNGVDLNAFRPRPDTRHELRARFRIPEDAFVAMIVARVDPQKDWDTVLRAVAQVPSLVTVAVGPTTDRLPDQPGLIKIGAQSDMAAIYALADAFILPSAFGEGTSVAMCEAMASGVPAIVTDVGDHARFIDGAGILIPRKDPEALASTLGNLRDAPAWQRALARGARAKAEMHFGMARSFAPLFDVWSRMLDRAP